MVQFTESQLASRGYSVSEEPPAGWNRTRPWVNKRTGEVQQVQVGIDPGWNHNTGVMGSTQKLNRLVERLDEDGRVWQASIIAADDEDGNRRTYLGNLERR